MSNTSAHGSDAVRFGVSPEIGAQAPPRRVRRRPGENRERLLTAGITVFGTHGYHGAQTAGIAALADVPQPHVYANFSTKQELFLACTERVCELLEPSMTSAGAPQPTGIKANPTAPAQVVSSHAAPIDESPAQAQAVQDERIYGSFLLQCVAASAEAKLQPALSALLLRLRERVGEQRVLDLIASSVGATLRN